AMGKKIKEEMDKQRDVFVEGAKKFSDIDNDLANRIFDLLAKFAEYGFNKAHAAAYAVISYQTAYLKHYYPVEYIIASTNMDIADTDKTNFYLADLKVHGIKILPPDINKSSVLFAVERIPIDDSSSKKTDIGIVYKNAKKYHENQELTVRYGFAGIKGVGENVGEEIVAERKKNGDFKTIFDFVERMNGKVINKKTMEALAKAGAFDNIHPNRKQVHDSCEVLSKYCVSFNEEKNSSQLSLFGGMGMSNNIKPVLARTDDWFGVERYQKEFEAFGFYLEGHPLDALKTALDERGITYSNELDTSAIVDGDKIRVAGVVISTSIKSSDKGRYAFISISDSKGMIEVALFSNDLIIIHKDWLDDKQHLQLEFDCMVKKDDGGFRVIANDFQLLQDFIKNTKPNTLQKITHKQPKREWNSDKKPWQQNGASGFYKKKEEKKLTDDPIVAQRMVAEPIKMIEKLDIYVKNQMPLMELSKIINITKKQGAKTWTKIVLHITDGEKEVLIDLGEEFQIYPLDKKRIVETVGVEKTE
ncbi:MAG: hypothetical protein PHY80_03795, partial [Rickettsiales bacterium]|nr:hypothetical protein [Rickettsiales bacterium]